MKFTSYTLSVGLISILMTSACQDHRIPVEIQSCQIVQEIVKSGTENNIGTSSTDETITIDGPTYGLPATKTFKLALNETHNYTYDNQKQLVQENILYNNPDPTSNNTTISYQYTPSSIKRSEMTGGITKGVVNYLLNGQGLISSIVNGNTTYKYNGEGYLIETAEPNDPKVPNGIQTTTYTIENGNVVKQDIVAPTFKLTTRYTYDLSKDNLPSKLTFAGKQSRNLLLKSIQDYTDFTLNLKTNFTSIYTYTYDNQGRVKRKLGVTTYRSAVGGAPLPTTPGTIFVSTTDYAYSCQ